MATRSSILAWKIPQIEKPGGLQSSWLQSQYGSTAVGEGVKAEGMRSGQGRETVAPGASIHPRLTHPKALRSQ